MAPALRDYGTTGIRVPPLALGAGQLGAPDLDDEAAARLLDGALDLGIGLIDTAPSYGFAEERIGRHLAHRRHEFILSTKFGYGVPGVPDWTPACIDAGVDLALRRLRTDVIDIAHLHSCDRATLEHSGVIDALEAAKRAGKLRAIAYSGEGDALRFAIDCGRFDGFMASLSLVDQRIVGDGLPRMAGKGFIAKRPLANAPWRHADRPRGQYVEDYWLRWRAMALPEPDIGWAALALRFVLGTPGVSAAVVGTAALPNLVAGLTATRAGPLAPELHAAIVERFAQCDDGWVGLI